MAEVFDPADLNKDGKVNYIDEDMARVIATKEAMQRAKDLAILEDQDRERPGFTGLSGLAESVPEETPVTRRDNAVQAEEPATSIIGIDLSTLDRAEENVKTRFQKALGEDLIMERKPRQSTDSNN